MATDYELFAHLRRPLPKWWIDGGARDPSYPIGSGVAFIIRREGGEQWRCLVDRMVFEILARSKIDDAGLERAWREHGDRFVSAAKRKITSSKVRPGRTVELGIPDLPLD